MPVLTKPSVPPSAALQAISAFPHLLSPAELAIADTAGRWKKYNHLRYLNKKLLDFAATPDARMMVCMPFRHGKSQLCSVYFIAWYLLMNPDTRILFAAHSEKFAAKWGRQVKDVVSKYGANIGIKVRQDSAAKAEWFLEGYQGGMVCKGVGSNTAGYDADLFVIDDPIGGNETAVSEVELDKQWQWFQSVVQGRVQVGTKILIVSTRWCKHDIIGHILAQPSGARWWLIKLKALAEDGDELGRQPGETLCPELVSLEQQLENRAQEGRWWRPCWQQEPLEETGAWFRPWGAKDDRGQWEQPPWPRYSEVSPSAWVLMNEARSPTVVDKDSCITLITVDWAISEKKWADYTAMIVSGLTRDGKVLILDVLNKRMRPEDSVPALAALCRRWRPNVVGVEGDVWQGALARDCAKFREIPEPYRLRTKNKEKLVRAQDAIMLGARGSIYLPELKKASVTGDLASFERIAHGHTTYDWLDPFLTQLVSFTGDGTDHDDMADALSWTGILARQLRGGLAAKGGGPVVFSPGKDFALPGGPGRWDYLRGY